MAQLLVRSLDDELVLALKRRAALHGRSAEEEHRAILRAALVKRPKRVTLAEFLLSGSDLGGDDAVFDRAQQQPRKALRGKRAAR